MPIERVDDKTDRLVHYLYHKEIPKVDPTIFTIVLNRLQSICEEIGTTVHRTAHSIIFSEGQDFSVALFDHEAHMVAMGEYIPAHQGGMQHTLENLVKEVGLENLRDGDIYMTNDALHGGASHPPDLTLFHPVYYQGELLAIVGVLVHHIDMGGMSPSSYTTRATEIYQEGIRFPFRTKLYDAGSLRRDILDIFLTNVRSPQTQEGDLMAQVSGVRVGARRLLELGDKYGGKQLRDTFIAIQHYSQGIMKEAVRAMPDGVYAAEDCDEGDGIEDKDFRVRCRMIKKNDRLVLDFRGTDKEAKGPINSHIGNTAANCFSLAMCFAPLYIPKNYGATTVVEVIAEKGTLVNASPTAPIGACTTEIGYVVHNVVSLCFAQATPQKASAIWGGAMGSFVYWGLDQRGNYYVTYCLDLCCTGGGARASLDGWPIGSVKGANMRLPNVEVEEHARPILYKYRRLQPPKVSSSGQGRSRGGPGIEFEIQPYGGILNFTLLSNKRKYGPKGVYGGNDGNISIAEVRDAKTGAVKQVLPPKIQGQVLGRNEAIYLSAPGGGGYGPPLERDPQKVSVDLKNHYATFDEARECYGVVINPDTMEVNYKATKALRDKMLVKKNA